MRLSHLRSRAFTSPFKQLASRSRSLMVLVLCGVTLAGAVNAAEAPFPGLRTLMDDEQFERSGLNKLSVSERAALNRWLAAHADFELAVITEAPEASSTSRVNTAEKVVAKPIDRKKRAAEEVIRTRVAGQFAGWTGKTIFSLENGQLWRQRRDGKYRYQADSPEVELYKNRMGFWEMRILATGKHVKVSRYQP